MDETDDLPRRQAASQYNHAEDARQIYRFSSGEANVRYGSLADIAARSRHVRFTPNSGHSSVQLDFALPLLLVSTNQPPQGEAGWYISQA